MSNLLRAPFTPPVLLFTLGHERGVKAPGRNKTKLRQKKEKKEESPEGQKRDQKGGKVVGGGGY